MSKQCDLQKNKRKADYIPQLGRNYSEILEQWRVITKDKRAGVRVLDMPLLDTGTCSDLTRTLIADIYL